MALHYLVACLQRFCADKRAQDLIEYALLAGFIAVAVGAIFPQPVNQISTIFSKVLSVLSGSASQG